MLDRVRTLIHRLKEVSEVNNLSERDLHDLGISRAQLLKFLDMPRDINDRVKAMAAIFGIPETTLKADQGQWLDLLTTCGQCSDQQACSHALDRGADPSECGFCGNHQVFAGLSPHAA